MRSKVMDEQVDFYSAHGWVTVEKLFSTDEVKEATSHVEAFVASGARELTGRHINRVNEEINSIHRLQDDQWINSVLHSQEMKDLVEPFLGDAAEPRKCELFAKPARVGLAAPPHQDNFLFCVEGGRALTVWVALDQSAANNGGLYYYDASHKLGLLEHEKSFAPGTSQQLANMAQVDHLKMIVPELRPGDALIHHSEIVHGSEPNTSEYARRGWTLQYKAESAAYDQTRLANYEAELAEQLEARGQGET